jgi:hypothetical protein
MLTAIGSIAMQQASAMQATMQATTQLLNCCATHPEATVRYIASDMVLHVESDASYITALKAQSCAAGYHFLSSRPQDPTKPPGPNDPPPPSNGAINVLCSIMREIVASAAEAELAALFHNGKEANPIRITLQELGHEQPPTLIQMVASSGRLIDGTAVVLTVNFVRCRFCSSFGGYLARCLPTSCAVGSCESILCGIDQRRGRILLNVLTVVSSR